MKNTIIKILIAACIAMVGLTPFTSFSQQKQEDTIFLSDGTQKKGKVLSVDDQSVKFSHVGEDAQYEIKKSSISKILFASGRDEIFSVSNPAPDNEQKSFSGTVQRSGSKLAVLPFEIASNDQGLTTDVMRREVQQACSDAIRAQAKNIAVQDNHTTNAALSKAGISLSEIANHTPNELATLLGVDYVVLGVYDIENKGTSTYGSGIASYDSKQKGDKEKGSVSQSNSSFSQINYDTKVQMAIYDNQGQQLFSDTRKPFIGNIDSYKGALKTLAKRMPLR